MYKLSSGHITLTQVNRLYQIPFPILAITGGIASGKSQATSFFTEKKIPSINADQLIKEVYQEQKTIEFIYEICPNSIIDKKICFELLRKAFFSNSEIKKKIESFLYLELPKKFLEHLEAKDFSQSNFLIYDVPLLFEKKLEPLCDLNLLIYCSKELQIKRIINRDHIKEALARKIISTQQSIEEKKAKAQHLIKNNKKLSDLEENLNHFLKSITD